MKRIFVGVALLLVAGNGLALKNDCKPGTTGCGKCFEYPTPPPGCETDSGGVSDFDGDFVNDLLFRNNLSSSLQVWIRYGQRNAAWKTFDPPGMGDSKWEAVATGYFEHTFDNDLDSDILWQHEGTRELRIWVMDKFKRWSTSTLTCTPGITCSNPAPPWKAVATGFFGAEGGDLDGLSDILFWNSATGDLKIWIMDGKTVVRETSLNWKMRSLTWNVIGTGFFGRGALDEFSDILWYNATTGEVRLWVMNGVQLLEDRQVGFEPDLDWKAVGVVDFDRKGSPDILFRKSGTGKLRYWKMDGPDWTGLRVVPAIPEPDLNWKPVAR